MSEIAVISIEEINYEIHTQTHLIKDKILEYFRENLCNMIFTFSEYISEVSIGDIWLLPCLCLEIQPYAHKRIFFKIFCRSKIFYYTCTWDYYASGPRKIREITDKYDENTQILTGEMLVDLNYITTKIINQNTD